LIPRSSRGKMRRSQRRSRKPSETTESDRTVTWDQAKDTAKTQYQPRQITRGEVCSICRKQKYNQCWMWCLICSKPVTHLTCIRQYSRQSDFRPLYCPNCNLQPILFRDGLKTSFPLEWQAVYVQPVSDEDSSDSERNESAE